MKTRSTYYLIGEGANLMRMDSNGIVKDYTLDAEGKWKEQGSMLDQLHSIDTEPTSRAQAKAWAMKKFPDVDIEFP